MNKPALKILIGSLVALIVLIVLAPHILYGIAYLYVTKDLHRYIRPTAQEDKQDVVEHARMVKLFTEKTHEAIDKIDPNLCQVLPEVFTPFVRKENGEIYYSLTTSDGPWAPVHYMYQMDRGCLIAYAVLVDAKACEMDDLPSWRTQCVNIVKDKSYFDQRGHDWFVLNEY